MIGSDYTSGVYGVGKKVVADRISIFAEATNLLVSCGAILDLTARVTKWRCPKIKGITRMIPNSDSLLNHFKRVDNMAFIEKNFHLKGHPSPLLHGWNIDNGLCLPTRSTLIALPKVMPEQMELSIDGSYSNNELQ